jgi:hypothetical protein
MINDKMFLLQRMLWGQVGNDLNIGVYLASGLHFYEREKLWGVFKKAWCLFNSIRVER